MNRHFSTNWLGQLRATATQWDIADDLEFVLKDYLETCHHNFDPSRREWLSHFDTPRGIIWMGTWRTLYPRWILHASDAISIHGGVLAGKPRAQVRRSGTEHSADWATATLLPLIQHHHFIYLFVCLFVCLFVLRNVQIYLNFHS